MLSSFPFPSPSASLRWWWMEIVIGDVRQGHELICPGAGNMSRFSRHPTALVRASASAELLHRCENPNFYSSKIYRWKKGVCLQKTRWMVNFLILLPLALHKAVWLPYKLWLWHSSFTSYTVFPLGCDPWLPESIWRPSSSLQYPQKSTWSHLYTCPCLTFPH